MSIFSHYFCLREDPFGETPDSQFFFPSSSHTHALAHIHSKLKLTGSLTTIEGEVGVGKTLLTRLVLNSLRTPRSSALLLNPVLNPTELVNVIVDELSVTGKERSLKESLQTLESFLSETSSTLVIDEAQCMPEESIVTLFKLKEYMSKKQLSFHILLFGQPEIRQVERILPLQILSIEPLRFNEMEPYIHTRIRKSGGEGFVRFEPSAIKEIYRESLGVPRLINRICGLGLLLAELEKKRTIDHALIKQVMRDWPGVDKQEAMIKDYE